MTSNQKRGFPSRSAVRPQHHHRHGARWPLLGLACAVLLGACSSGGPILQSQNVSPNARYPLRGTSYYLPKKLLRVRVWEHAVYALNKDGTPKIDKGGKVTNWVPFAMHAKDGRDEIIVPDHRHQFIIAPLWDVASDDNIRVKLDTDGLLSQVHSRAADQRTEIARNAVDLFSMLISGRSEPRGGAATMRGGDLGPALTPRFIAEYEFDPVDCVDMARVQDALLSKYGIQMSITKQPDCPSASSGGGCDHTCDCTKPGIYYRLPIPYRFRLEPAGRFRPHGILGAGEEGEWEILRDGMEQTVLLPNEAICIYAPVTRASFVTSYTNLDFDRGMLTEAVTDKPSQMLGFIKIPIDAASAILAIPAELLTVRIKQTSQRTGLAEAQYMNLQEQINALEAARLLEARKAGHVSGE